MASFFSLLNFFFLPCWKKTRNLNRKKFLPVLWNYLDATFFCNQKFMNYVITYVI